ncbi:MAG: hypothetical protein COV55_04245 [Candidatus Komeilibacteria bacterium CG11_big_fil_rev_8_21_14_0_20_36_20]|uniref:Uncharacterized protein n=1 Tax=Candidatus Komeilibacteria bacterium CG11_big_fil_rev_8_21_14_0_20_36_20 TaxID=1974477 RepID=A0A2H0NBP4_9BACT|nr:MAG: hypothetical protein COV55_04245 [Candidatus Komeilibacteria bacterium CG11_big_fil_rev_8_21_14_0_20_36_20]PIR81454.1 MAG: hypothetical protein COU21_03475 [Candidatus Komeilibacteria bacterium CG10_big_fil_rev_8_21_14_0_10_36_65]PJC55655.1 MAG: hypothetical protein CO027_00830 [Candidatus Komeilibacteria bacterium CG_4_9_14_0_2_um_filter_36_13]
MTQPVIETLNYRFVKIIIKNNSGSFSVQFKPAISTSKQILPKVPLEKFDSYNKAVLAANAAVDKFYKNKWA